MKDSILRQCFFLLVMCVHAKASYVVPGFFFFKNDANVSKSRSRYSGEMNGLLWNAFQVTVLMFFSSEFAQSKLPQYTTQKNLRPLSHGYGVAATDCGRFHKVWRWQAGSLSSQHGQEIWICKPLQNEDTHSETWCIGMSMVRILSALSWYKHGECIRGKGLSKIWNASPIDPQHTCN